MDFILPHEKQQFEAIKSSHPKYWVPIQWAMLLVREAKRQAKLEPGVEYISSVSTILPYHNFRIFLGNHSFSNESSKFDQF